PHPLIRWTWAKPPNGGWCMVPQRRIVVFASHALGERLDKLIAAELNDLSRTQVQRLMDEGWVKLNGQVVTKAGQRLEAPAQIEVCIPPPAPSSYLPENIPLDILFENKDLLVINK